MMQAIGLLYLGFIIFASCLIARFLYVKFSKYPMHLIVVYLICITLVLSWLGIKYWQLAHLNNHAVLFTQNTGNSLAFTFTPKSSGSYSVDLTFLNDKVNKEYEACGLPWMKSSERECKKALIFRTLSGTIKNQHFSSKARYQNWQPGDLDYGYSNHNITGAALNIFKFHGIANVPVQMRIKIDAKIPEIQSSNPAIVIGADEENFMSMSSTLFSFGIIVIPFLFSIILLFIKTVKNKKEQ